MNDEVEVLEAPEVAETPEVVETPETPEIETPEPTNTVPPVVAPEPTREEAYALAVKHGFIQTPQVQQQQPVVQAPAPETDAQVHARIVADVEGDQQWANPVEINRRYTDYVASKQSQQIQQQQQYMEMQSVRPIVEATLEQAGVPKEQAAYFDRAVAMLDKSAFTDHQGYHKDQHYAMAAQLLAGGHTMAQGKIPGDTTTPAASKGRQPQNPQGDTGAPAGSVASIGQADRSGYNDFCKNWDLNPNDKASIAKFKAL